MHEVNLPRRYRTIILCGAFGLGGDRAQDAEGLRRIYEHLEPGGTLVLDNQVPYSYANWHYWTEEGRKELPGAEPSPGERMVGPDGAEYELRHRVLDVDPFKQLVSSELRGLMWRDGELVADEVHVLKMTLYFAGEIELMLERAGFRDVEARGAYRDEPPTREDEFIVFSAVR
jgi:hypothetical protein